MKQGISELVSSPPPDANAADILVDNHGSVFLFWPLTPAAREWLAEHCPADDEHQYFTTALVVEHRYVSDLIAHAIQDGLSAFSPQNNPNERTN